MQTSTQVAGQAGIGAEKRYPIAEVFTSIQGEGSYAGTRMTFVRFAGCNVGRPFTTEERGKWQVGQATEAGKAIPVLQPYQEKCTDWRGESFACDTNYSMARKMTIAEILQEVPWDVRHVCLTGGEPLLHDLRPLISELIDDRDMDCVHLETSGTKSFRALQESWPIELYVAVSPKQGYLEESLANAGELKLLVGVSTSDSSIRDFLGLVQDCCSDYGAEMPALFVQPVNLENELDMASVKRCMELIHTLTEAPGLQLSIQLHKIVGVR